MLHVHHITLGLYKSGYIETLNYLQIIVTNLKVTNYVICVVIPITCMRINSFSII